MRTPLFTASLSYFAITALAGCVIDVPQTQCLADIDCPTGFVCSENEWGDLICVPGGSDGGGGGGDIVDPVDTGTDAGSDTGGVAENCTNEVDDDGDGDIDCADTECVDRPVCRRCGDGVIQQNEECDGEALGEESCETLGFPGGQLSCTELCRYDLRDCNAPDTLLYAWDSWAPGQEVEGNFEILDGDLAYACYATPSEEIDYFVTRVALGISGEFETRRSIDLLIWDQSADLTSSTLLFQEQYSARSSFTDLQEVTLADAQVRVSGFFCLGVLHNGFTGPTLANDFDGISAPSAQGLVRTIGGIEQAFSIDEIAVGDWILRATIVPAVR